MSDVIYIVERSVPQYGYRATPTFVDAYKSKNDAVSFVEKKNSNANCWYHYSYRMKKLK